MSNITLKKKKKQTHVPNVNETSQNKKKIIKMCFICDSLFLTGVQF